VLNRGICNIFEKYISFISESKKHAINYSDFHGTTAIKDDIAYVCSNVLNWHLYKEKGTNNFKKLENHILMLKEQQKRRKLGEPRCLFSK
jgi:hypothetical protein